jgi:hypothetical protein
MSKIHLLVDHLRLTPPDTSEKYNQTSVLPMPSYYLLCGLAEYLHMPRTRLSGMLLAAAIDEAITALPPSDPVDYEGRQFGSPAEYVSYLAWKAQGHEEDAEVFSAKRTPKTTT